MNEHVLSTALRLDETVALRRVEPLYRSGRHLRNLQSLDNERGTGCAFRRNPARAIRLILGRQPGLQISRAPELRSTHQPGPSRLRRAAPVKERGQIFAAIYSRRRSRPDRLP